KIVRSEHPVMQGLESPLRTADMPRRGFTLSQEANILAATDKGDPLLFSSSHGKGRVFCDALGHGLGAMLERVFITTFLRGAEWAATGQVTLPGEIGVPGPETNGVRVLVITGGHDHETSFYGLFDGYKDIGWVSVADSKLAFQQDIRARYDVLVFYDFTRDLDDLGKKNLREFVGSNKGLVVLHHGILDFQKWPWWYEEVVGGLYRLERQGSVPNSTVKFGEEHMITPAGEHPITAGIGPFHITDETCSFRRTSNRCSSRIIPPAIARSPGSDLARRRERSSFNWATIIRRFGIRPIARWCTTQFSGPRENLS